MKSELSNTYQQEAERFKNIFSSLADKKIVLYGIGRFSSTLIPRISDTFKIVGLMDRDENNIGKLIFGLPVLSLEEAEKQADCIIINTTSTYWQTIFKRIKNSKIPVYFLNGKEASTDDGIASTETNPYWNVNFEDYKKLADEADVVSFDLFDTLLLRMCYLPTDVYALASEIAKEKLEIPIDYSNIRRDIRSDLPAIYNWQALEEALIIRYNPIIARILLDAELEAESRLCVPRKFMCDFCRELIDKGKTVYIVTDMYLPKEFIFLLLGKIGLSNIPLENVWISGEIGAGKQDGELWRLFFNKVVKGKKAVHFGDDEIADVKMAERTGITPCYVMNCRTMLCFSNISSIASGIVSLYESVVMGLLLTKLFDSPFVLNRTKGRISLNTCQNLGYVAYAPLLVTFLVWLQDVTHKAGIKRLFFFARDGFFLERDYKTLCDIFKEKDAPEAFYLYISRQAAWIASISSEEDFNDILSKPYIGSFENYMKSRWDIDVDDRTIKINKQYIDQFDDLSKLKDSLEPYIEEIKGKVRLDRENYLSYLGSLHIGEDCGFVDQGIHGTIQYYLSKILSRPIRSWNIVAQEDIFSDGNEQYSCYRGPDRSGYISPLAENIIFLETFLTAPYGMVRRVYASGNRVSDEAPKSQKYFADKELINDGVEQFMRDMASIFGKKPVVSMHDREFVAALLLLIYQGGSVFKKEAVRSFVYENPTMHIGESKVFD